jgi:transcriptional regulator with XRE-family HTH domain
MAKTNPPGPVGACLGLSLFRLRMRNEWSQREVAERATEQGRYMTGYTVMNIERGHRRIDVDDLVALAKVFHVTPAALISNAIPRQVWR